MLSVDIGVVAVPVFVIDVRPDGTMVIAAMNRPSELATGFAAADTVGRSPADCLPPRVAASVEPRYRRCAETKSLQEYDETFDDHSPHRWWRTTLTPIMDPVTGTVVRIVSVSIEITERKRDEDRLQVLAWTDGLTGLLNRRGFERAYAETASRHAAAGKPFGLLLIDLDGFKAINDTFGHQRGDDALRSIGLLLRGAAGRPETVARIGGDEFALLASASTDRELERTVGALRRFLDRNLDAAGALTGLGASVGSALRSSGQTFEDLLGAADAAMYRQKADRKAFAA